MPVVIDLLSSPLNSPPKVRHNASQHSASTTLAKDMFHFSSDDFELSRLSGDLDFPIAQPTKKRRLSPDENDIATPSEPRKPQVITLSDDDDLLPFNAPAATASRSATATYGLDALVSDPIGFSSSAPEVRKTGHGRATILDLSDGLPEDILSFSLSQPAATNTKGRNHLSERTTNLLSTLHDKSTDVAGKSRNHKSVMTTTGRSLGGKPVNVFTLLEDISSSPPVRQSARPPKHRDPANDARAVERAATKAAKDRKKEEEKERKRLAKEQKAKEKQEAAHIAEVNKSKTDKKVSVTEMIVNLSENLQGKNVGNQVLEYMKHLEVETSFFEDDLDDVQDRQGNEPFGNLVKWRRKVEARYSEDAGHWEPLATTTIEEEKHILVHLTASDFAALASSRTGSNHEDGVRSQEAMTKNIDAHVSYLRKTHKGCKPIYLIEGLESFLRKGKTAKNRAYNAAVRSQIPPSNPAAPPPSSQARRKKKAISSPDYSFIDTDLAESLLLHLQIRHSVLIQQTTSPSDTASWIRTFTEHISTIPYRLQRQSLNDAGAAFCMDVGQVKTGDSPLDTYVKMLQEVTRVTPAMAYGIADLYPSVRELVKAFREEGQLVLEDVRKGANRDGAVTDSRLGPAVSRRLYKVFMGRDEWSMDGIA